MDLTTLPAVTSADLAQPVNADFYTQHGATPEQAAALAAQHNTLAGRGGFNTMADAREQTRNMPPPPAPTAPAPTSNATLFEAAAGHENMQIAGTLDAAFQPPANAFDYRFPEGSTTPTDEQLASDGALKAAFHAAQLPKFVVESIAQNLAEASRNLANETPQQSQARIDSQKTRLAGMWGKEFDGNMQIVDAFLEQQAAKSPALRSFLEGAVRAFTPLDIDLILQTAKHRAIKR
jgi:hypothetical protein